LGLQVSYNVVGLGRSFPTHLQGPRGHAPSQSYGRFTEMRPDRLFKYVWPYNSPKKNVGAL